MSYIRCTSNPEGLYVYHDVRGTIFFDSVDIPANLFYRFIKLMPRWDSNFKRGRLEIKEVAVPCEREIPVELKDIYKNLDIQPCISKICFYYQGVEIARMWPVTWKYIYENVMRYINTRKNKKKVKK